MPLTIQDLRQRKSHSKLGTPAPDQQDIMDMLSVACTVPDHASLRPYRFVVVGPEQKQTLAKAFQASLISGRPDAAEHVLEKVAGKAHAAPIQIYLIYSPIVGHRIPDWEQQATAACTGYAITLAAEALGYSAIWKSFGYADEKPFREYLQLQEHEKNIGWINLGTSLTEKPMRMDKNWEEKVDLRL